MGDDRQEWLKWRNGGIGASDAPILHRESEWCTVKELFLKKTSSVVTETEDTFVTRRGNELEPIARTKFAAIYNMEHGTNETFEPKRVQMADLPYMLATLDGCSCDGKVILEIKYMSEPEKPDKKITVGQQKHRDVLKGIVPKIYWIQVQHQLLVTGADVCYFASFNGESLHSTMVYPDLEFMKKHLKICADFREAVEKRIMPEPSPDDVVELKDKEAVRAAKKWASLKLKVDAMSDEMDALKELILKAAFHTRMTCAGISLLKMAGKKGAIDYVKILNDLKADVDVEKYRKPTGGPSWKMEVIKK